MPACAPAPASNTMDSDSSPSASERSRSSPSGGTTGPSRPRMSSGGSSRPTRPRGSLSEDEWEADADMDPDQDQDVDGDADDLASASDDFSLCAESDDESTASICSGATPTASRPRGAGTNASDWNASSRGSLCASVSPGGAGTSLAPSPGSAPARKIFTNSRERCRQQSVSEAFDDLRKLVPRYPHDKKLSKNEILRNAIRYIKLLQSVLDWQQKHEGITNNNHLQCNKNVEVKSEPSWSATCSTTASKSALNEGASLSRPAGEVLDSYLARRFSSSCSQVSVTPKSTRVEPKVEPISPPIKMELSEENVSMEVIGLTQAPSNNSSRARNRRRTAPAASSMDGTGGQRGRVLLP